MSQISLPWIEQDPERHQELRHKAITWLLGGSSALLLLAVIAAIALSKLPAGVDLIVVLMLTAVGPGATGLLVAPLGLFGRSPVMVAAGCAMVGAGVANTAILLLTPINPAVFGVLTLVIGPLLGGFALGTAGLVVLFFPAVVWIFRLRYVPIMMFVGGVVGAVLLVWAHALLFRYVDEMVANPKINAAETSFLGGPLTIAELTQKFSGREIPLAYALWPLQYRLVRDLLGLGGVIGFISIVPLFGIWWERKIAARMQSRLGPMRVGGWHGWSQSLADGIKLIFKEDLIPKDGDRVLFRLAPYIAFVPAVCAFIALPFAGAYVFRDLDVALIFILAMLGIEVVGVILAGWASNNKWSVYGAMREACQMVSYEIPMGMALLIPVMTVGSLQLTAITEAQAEHGFASWLAWRNPWCFLAFLMYYVASLASCKRAPFDLPESESELVAGFHTEYSGFRWSLFFFAEYAAMFAVSGLAVILFLGGWKSPLPADMAYKAAAGMTLKWYQLLVNGLIFDGPILFVLKSAFLFYVQLWVRWTLPRIRIDQVLYACVQVLLPFTMLILLANTLWMLGLSYDLSWLKTLDEWLRYGLITIGALTILACLVIATHGYMNRRRLVGTLVIEHLPGA